MATQTEAPINVLLAVEFSEADLSALAALSPRLQFVTHPTSDPGDIGLDILAETDILYTACFLPDPETVPRLGWVQLHSAGVSQFLDDPLYKQGEVRITTSSGIQATTIAEYTFSMFLAFGHRLSAMLNMKTRREWPHSDLQCVRYLSETLTESALNIFLPMELRGTTLGIVGYGSIGREVARLGAAFGMTILASKRDLRSPAEVDEYSEPGTGDPEAEIVDRLYPPEALQSMLSACDFVVVTVPLTDATRGMIDAEMLAAMKSHAILVNVARGELIDETALVEALQEGRLGGAALDVFEQEPLPEDHPFWTIPNIILSPHIAGMSYYYNQRAARLFTENMHRYLNKEPLLNLVDRTLGY